MSILLNAVEMAIYQKKTKEKVIVPAYLRVLLWVGLMGKNLEWQGQTPAWFRIEKDRAVDEVREFNFHLLNFDFVMDVDKCEAYKK